MINCGIPIFGNINPFATGVYGGFSQMPAFNNSIFTGYNFSLPSFMPFNFGNLFSFPSFSFPTFNFQMPQISFPMLNFATPSVSAGRSENTESSSTNCTDVNKKMVAKAKSYVGKVNSSEEGNRLFSPAGYKNTSWYKKYGRWGWCCDFAVHCAKDTLGSRYPKDMITSSPDGLMGAAEQHNAYLPVPSSNKNSWLSSNIKPGDIIYMVGKGDSGKHIAVVESVDEKGNIKAISGNSGGKVRNVTYNIATSGIYGFISLNKI